MCLCVYIYIYRERERERDVYFKEFSHKFVKAWQIQNLQRRQADWRPREELQFESKSSLLAEFLLAWGSQSFSVKAIN